MKEKWSLTARQSYHLMLGGVFGGCGLGLLTYLLGTDILPVFAIKTLFFLATVLMMGGILQTTLFFHCPHCKKGFPLRGGMPGYCPKCGKKVEA